MQKQLLNTQLKRQFYFGSIRRITINNILYNELLQICHHNRTFMDTLINKLIHTGLTSLPSHKPKPTTNKDTT